MILGYQRGSNILRGFQHGGNKLDDFFWSDTAVCFLWCGDDEYDVSTLILLDLAHISDHILDHLSVSEKHYAQS